MPQPAFPASAAIKGLGLSVAVLVVVGMLYSQVQSSCGPGTPQKVVLVGAAPQQQEKQKAAPEPPPLIQDAKEPLVSWHRCNGPNNTVCMLYDVCYDGASFTYIMPQDPARRQAWQSFPLQPPSKDIPSPLLYLSGRREQRSLLTLGAAERPPASYSYARGAHALVMLHGVSNVGHAILENAMPLLNNVLLFGEDLGTVRVVLHRGCSTPDDYFTTGDPHPSPLAAPMCEANLKHWMQPLFDQPLAVLGDAFPATAERPVCFERLLLGLGHTGFHLNDVSQRGLTFRTYRDLVWRRLGLRPRASCERLSVVIHNKIGRRNVSNIHEVYDQMRRTERFEGFPVDVRLLTMDDLPREELLDLTVGTDVFVSCGGSALFNGIIMRDGAVVVGTPLFDMYGKIINDEFANVVHHIPQARYVEYGVRLQDISLSGHLSLKVDASLAPQYLAEALQYAVMFKHAYHGCPKRLEGGTA